MKSVFKVLPVSLYDIPGVEQWLEEQANSGLFPTHLGSWASFSRNGVPGTRFRLEPWGKTGTEPEPEQLELYRSAGWEYAFSIARAYYLFYAADPNAAELYSDLATRGQSLDRLAAQVRRARATRALIPLIPFVVIIAALLWPASRFDVQPDRWARLPVLLLYLGDPALLILLIAACFSVPREYRDYSILLATYRSLKNGLPPKPSPTSRKRLKAENIATLLLLPLLALCLILNYTVPQSVPISRFDLPYVSMRDIESEPMATFEELFSETTRRSADENQASRRFSLLAPSWYEVSQSLYSYRAGTQTNAFSTDPEGGKYRYSPDLDMTRFSLLLPALSRPAARAQMDIYRAINLKWSYEEVEYPGADFVIIARADDGISQMAALGKGRNTAVFRYSGQENLAEHLDLLMTMVSP